MLYLCWAKNNNIIGVATSKKHAERMCEEIGSCSGGEMATHSNILAWEILWTEELGGLHKHFESAR